MTQAEALAQAKAHTTLLKEINLKLNILPEIKEQLKILNTMATDFSQNRREMDEIKTKINEISEEFMLGSAKLNPITTYADILLKEKSIRETTSEAYLYRKLNKQKWGFLKNKRKHAYYNSIKSAGTATIYTDFLGKETPFIPRKFLGENADIEEAKKKMQDKIKELREYNMKSTNLIEECETNITNLIALGALKPETKQKLQEIWEKEIEIEKNKSDFYWEKKRNWLQNLEHSENQPQINSQNRPRSKQGFHSNRNRNTRDARSTTQQSTAEANQPRNASPRIQQDKGGRRYNRTYANVVNSNQPQSSSERIMDSLLNRIDFLNKKLQQRDDNGQYASGHDNYRNRNYLGGMNNNRSNGHYNRGFRRNNNRPGNRGFNNNRNMNHFLGI